MKTDVKTDVAHIISVQELLLWGNKNEEFCKEARKKHPKIKLLRHSDDREKVIDSVTTKKSPYYLYLEEPELFDKYQNEQKTNLFKNVKYIVSFLGEEGITARFIGIYKNCGIKDQKSPFKDHSIFDFQKIDGFAELENKLVINWTTNTQSWHQFWDKEKYVIRIDRGLTENGMPVFTSYENVMLSYSELKKIYESKSKNNEWKSRLEACNCIYLILDKSNGKQYVGSTYSSNTQKLGIWKRWEEYSKTGHGGNKSLEALCTKDPQYHVKNFQWTILEVLPLNVAPLVAIERESFYKKKFGTAEPNGYNNN